MIGIIDYGAGNLGSVTNAFRFLEIPARVVTTPDALRGIDAMVLPGVGAFGDCLRKLRARGFERPVRNWIDAGRPFLGICVGLQALYEGSEESPDESGLGIFPGRIRRFENRPGLKVPQIGWNSVRQTRRECPLFAGIPDQSYFYFVHSFRADPALPESAGETDYGGPFSSVVWRANVMAIQFHPEKSQKVGLMLLQNFADWAYERTAAR
jgi:glutamine amidotransferase